MNYSLQATCRLCQHDKTWFNGSIGSMDPTVTWSNGPTIAYIFNWFVNNIMSLGNLLTIMSLIYASITAKLTWRFVDRHVIHLCSIRKIHLWETWYITLLRSSVAGVGREVKCTWRIRKVEFLSFQVVREPVSVYIDNIAKALLHTAFFLQL